MIANAAPDQAAVVERVTEAGATTARETPLGIDYPRDVFSLSHVALPFPPSDGLYGSEPDPAEDFGVNFGTMASRGETGALIVSQDALSRISWNPFFAYVQRRIEDGIGGPL